MNKPMKTILIIAILVFALTPLVVSAEYMNVLSNPVGNFYSWQDWVPQSENSTRAGDSFQGNGQYLTSVSWYIANDSVSEFGTLRAAIWENSTENTYCYTPLDADPPMAYANSTYSLSGLGSPYYITFLWDNGTVFLNASRWYTVALECAGDWASNIHFGVSNSGGSCKTSGAYREWTTHPYGPIINIVSSDTANEGEEVPTPSPTATPPPGSTGTEGVINDFVDYLIPLILFLLPALILGWVTKWQKWPIIIGLAIGAGLTYLFLGTTYLWLVVMIIIGIASMAYSDFRGGG